MFIVFIEHTPSGIEHKGVPTAMASLDIIRKEQRADGTATVMAIGLANTPNAIEQRNFGHFYFRATNSEHLAHLKDKYNSICNNSMINKRYLYYDEELLKKHPSICDPTARSFNIRQDILTVEVPKLGNEAAIKAIDEWGRPKSSITHLIFVTSGGVDMPSADYRLANLLGLSPSVSRHMVYMQGCFAGAAALRLAKDVAENNKGSRVLVVCSEISIGGFTGPDESRWDMMISSILFGDGAAAVIVGSDPVQGIEKPIFELVSAKQTFLPDTEDSIRVRIREEGLRITLSKENPKLISSNIEECLAKALKPLGLMPSDWNSLFWMTHPGGRAILDKVEEKLKLEPKKLRASRHVLREYGNMRSTCVLFIMDEMRKRSAAEGLATTGEGLEWGVLHGFGPGITVETVVLRSVPIQKRDDTIDLPLVSS